MAVSARGGGLTPGQLNAQVRERRQLALLQELQNSPSFKRAKQLLNPPVRGFPIDPTLTVRGRPKAPSPGMELSLTPYSKYLDSVVAGRPIPTPVS